MLSINLRRAVVTGAVIAGLLAASAGQASATITMLDYEGSPVVTLRAPHEVATDNKDPDKLLRSKTGAIAVADFHYN